ALLRHHREVPHEDRLLLDLARLGVHEAGGDEEGAGEGHVLLLALLLGVLRGLELGVGQLQLQGAGEVFDGRDVGEGFGDPLLEEPFERIALHGHQIRQRHDFTELCERETLPSRETGQSLTPSDARRRPSRGEEGKGTRRRQTASIAVATLARQLHFHGSCELMMFAGYDVRCRRSRVVDRPGGDPPPVVVSYFSSTVAPAASSWAFAFSASSLETFSRTGLGAPSTRSLASFRPRLVSERTSLMTWIFLSPAAARMTSNSSFSSAAAACSPPPPPPGPGPAAAVTPNSSSKAFRKSLSSRTVMFLKMSRSSVVLGMALRPPVRIRSGSRR